MSDGQCAVDLDVLLRRVATGDHVAFAALYDALIPEVHRLVSSVLTDPGSTASIVRDTFVELWRVAPQPDLTGGLSLRTWVLADAFRRSRSTRPS